jgi:hypothetical protein
MAYPKLVKGEALLMAEQDKLFIKSHLHYFEHSETRGLFQKQELADLLTRDLIVIAQIQIDQTRSMCRYLSLTHSNKVLDVLIVQIASFKV